MAAVLTQTMPFVKRWIESGKDAATPSYLFGCSCERAVETENDELIRLILSERKHGFTGYDTPSSLGLQNWAT